MDEKLKNKIIRACAAMLFDIHALLDELEQDAYIDIEDIANWIREDTGDLIIALMEVKGDKDVKQ